VTVVPPDEQPTTALTVEARGGFVHVFLPPSDHLDDYVLLLRVVENTAAVLGTTVVLEG